MFPISWTIDIVWASCAWTVYLYRTSLYDLWWLRLDLVHRLFIIFACQEFGDINRIEQDKEANRLILTFTTRKQAEIVSS